MSALAMMQRSERVTHPVDYQRMSLKKHAALASQSHPEHTEAAAVAFVNRMLDMEVERRTIYGDEHLQGYPAQGLGDAPGGTDIAREPLADLYDRGIADHQAHKAAQRFIEGAGLTFRQRVAVLIVTAKADRRCNGPRAMTYAQIVDNPRPWVQYLGWPPGAAAMLFKDTKALDNAASEARKKLMRYAIGPEDTICCENQDVELHFQ